MGIIKQGKEIFDSKQILIKEKNTRDLNRLIHSTIARTTIDIEDRFHFNTAISALMELLNGLSSFKNPLTDEEKYVFYSGIRTMCMLISPMAPHLAEELWELMGNAPSVFNNQWQSYDPEALKTEQIEMVIQVNGKIRSRIFIPVDSSDEEIKQLALSDEKTAGAIAGKNLKKVIIVPKKLVNIVVS